MAGIMDKDAYIKVWRKAEVLEKELDYEKARNKTLIKEVTADCETIKARDAKIEELKLEVEKWKSKLEHTVAMYEEEANTVEEKRKDEAYRFDQAQDRISELELELDILRSKNRNMEGAVNEAIGLAATNAQYLQRIEELEEELEKYKIEVRRLNAACRHKNDWIDKLYGALNYDGWAKLWEDNHEHN